MSVSRPFELYVTFKNEVYYGSWDTEREANLFAEKAIEIGATKIRMTKNGMEYSTYERSKY